MAKELIIAFIYDSELCQREEDDPQQAVLYFYPSWVTDEQRLVLCGQLIGVTHFIESTFSPPSILSLQSGKFSIKIFGRYILCVGTDRNIPDSVLQARASILHLLLQFYHGDFSKFISKNSANRQELHDKLSCIFEIYLPIIIFAGNIFSTIAVLTLPKSGSTAFLEASQILQHFQRKPGVLGGIILYQNKVVVSQLSNKLTKVLVISDPYRIKTPATAVKTPFHLPFRVQLLNVYLSQHQCQELLDQSNQMSSALNAIPFWQADDMAKNQTQPTTVPPVYMSSMKRDKSTIFTVLEEEDDDVGEKSGGASSINNDAVVKSSDEFKKRSQSLPLSSATQPSESDSIPDVVKDAMHARWISRLQSVTPASFVIPDINSRLFPYLTTDNVPSSTALSNLRMRYYSLGLPQIKEDWCNSVNGSESPRNTIRPYYNTISDPVNPLFRSSGLPASKSLYHNRLADHYEHFDAVFVKKNEKSVRPTTVKFKETPKEISTKQEKLKKNLSLSLNTAPPSDIGMVSASDLRRGMSQGVPLTPLMAKLTMLANNETQTPIASTPSTSIPRSCSFTKIKSKRILKTESDKDASEIPSDDVELKEAVLFVFGENSTSLMLLMEPSTSQDPDQIHSLWESSTSLLSDLESRFRTCMEHCPNTTMSTVDSYSFMCVEPDWGTTQRGGSWTAPQLELLTTLQNDLSTRRNITDVIVRCDESIVYGYQCGQKQVFYQQSAGSNNALAGLPTPSDLMGVVPLKARRRLERDHNIIIL